MPESASATTFVLVRHAHYPAIGGFITGHGAGHTLDEEGREQARALAERLRSLPLAAVYTSPLERAVETAELLAAPHGRVVRTDQGLIELDPGEWTGATFAELEAMGSDSPWRRFNMFRSGTPPPRGEHAAALQARMVAALDRLRTAHRGEMVAVVSHGDPIRTVLCYYLGIPLDLSLRVEIDLASVSILALHDAGPRLLLLNSTGQL